MQKKIVKIFNLKGDPIRETQIPKIFETPLRQDVIKRAVLSSQSKRLQPQGRDPLAGKRTSATSRGVGLGISRIPRIKGGSGRAALAPGTVGGRLAHPPRSEKKIIKQIPKKEKRLALFSAIAATGSKKTVVSRGHAIGDISEFPLIVTDDLEKLTKTKEVKETLQNLGITPDLDRVKESWKVRAGKGKLRGRKMKKAIGPLIVITENKGIIEASRNILGVNIVKVDNLNAEILAPGTHPGRLTLWTNGTLKKLEQWCSKGEKNN